MPYVPWLHDYEVASGFSADTLSGPDQLRCLLNGVVPTETDTLASVVAQVLAYCGIGLVASILGELAAGVWRVPVDLVL